MSKNAVNKTRTTGGLGMDSTKRKRTKHEYCVRSPLRSLDFSEPKWTLRSPEVQK